MREWSTYWAKQPRLCDESDFLHQVGKTVGGKPIAEEQFGRIVTSIAAALSLQQDDILLDLCCGNGLVTMPIAHRCSAITAIDYSPGLIAIAKKHHGANNIKYLQGDVRELSRLIRERTFNKIFMYEALQHFQPHEIDRLLRDLRQLSGNHIAILFGSIPDRSRKWSFYNSVQRKIDYLIRLSRGTEAIGYWWKRKELEAIAIRHGFHITFNEQDPLLYTAHYRFDALLTE